MDHKVLVTLLLSVFSFVLVMSVFLVFMIVHFRHHKVLSISAGKSFRDDSAAIPLDHRHFGLKRPMSWLAIKNRNLLSVQSALALHNPKPCSWVEGMSGDSDRKLFISPPVSGWILVIGSALPDAGDDVDSCFRFLMNLSRKLGHVQFFSANSILNHHAWVHADTGHVLRAYVWAGRTLWDQGKPTPAETELAMKCYGYTDGPELSTYGSAEPGSTNADKVHLLAARWSLDPDDIDERFIEQEWGIVGEPSHRF